jgi:membrane dipeptidase
VDSLIKYSIPLLIALAATASCRYGGEEPEDLLAERAKKLAQDVIIVDTHIDVPYRLTEKMEDVGLATEGGDFDYPRARAGGLDVAFMSIYVPASYQETGGGKELADELIDLVEGIVEDHPDKFALAASVDEARQRVEGGKIVLALGMENGAPIEGELDNLAHFHARGIRYITLAHSKSNRICDSSYDDERRWKGLSPFGREVVAEMNRLGIMIDISHITDDATRQVLELSEAPVIASHSSCRHFTPDWERNISDELIREVSARGGVIQINFGSGFVDDAYRVQWLSQWDELEKYFEEHDIDEESQEAEEYREDYRKQHPIEPAGIAAVADHIDHVVELVGIDHVGFGSDFDGLGDSLPHGLQDVSEYPNLIRELLERGYSDDEIRKICSDNILRVWSEVERVARTPQADRAE